MGLITKEVEVTLGVRNIKYYEKLGYKIPKYENRNHELVVKRGTKIKVKIEDLSSGSNVEIEYECDMCHKLFTTRYDVYSTHNKNGKTLCPYCAEAPHVMKGCKKKNSNKKEKKVNHNKKNRFRKYKNKYYNRPNTYEYSIFVKKVLNRDNYECQCCHSSSNLEVHHLDGYNWCIERRTDDTNGITLCKNCHTNFHIKYGRGNNTKEQYEEWIGYAIGDLEKYDGELPTAKEVFDYERNEIYESAESYSKIYGVNASNVRACCSHKNTYKKIKGKDGTEKINKWTVRTVNGHHLFWLDEYKNMTQYEIQQFLQDNKRKARTRQNNESFNYCKI